jgi:hypothetical protein
MNSPSILALALQFIFYLLIQTLLFRNVALFGFAFAFPYISYLLLLPFETSRIALMLNAFAMGIILDVFYDAPGFHAAVGVIIAYLRPSIINFNVPIGGYDQGMQPTLKIMGFRWFVSYTSALILIHHFLFFVLEASSTALLGHALIKTLLSTICTLLVILIIQYIVHYPQNRR